MRLNEDNEYTEDNEDSYSSYKDQNDYYISVPHIGETTFKGPDGHIDLVYAGYEGWLMIPKLNNHIYIGECPVKTLGNGKIQGENRIIDLYQEAKKPNLGISQPWLESALKQAKVKNKNSEYDNNKITYLIKAVAKAKNQENK